MSTSNDLVRERSKFVDVTAAKVLTLADSGDTFVLKAAAGAAIILPAVTEGFKIKVITGLSFASTAWTITCPSAIGQGGAIVNSVFVAASDETTITVAHGAESIGDYLEIESDGTSYFINGVGALAGAYTFA
jgi:diphthamide biosynthesis methyltransferase